MMGNGILGALMGIIFFGIMILVGIISGVITIANTIEFVKTKNYIQLNAQVTDRTLENDLAKNSITYTVDGKNYTDTFFGLDKNVGDVITIYYDSQNPSKISLGERSIPIVLLLLTILFLGTSTSTLIRNMKNIKHTFNSNQYPVSNHENNQVSISFGQSAMNQRTTMYDPFDPNDPRKEHEVAEGDTTTFKF